MIKSTRALFSEKKKLYKNRSYKENVLAKESKQRTKIES